MKTISLAFTLFTILLSHFASAQHRISGKVAGNDKLPITAAVIELKSGDKPIEGFG